MKLIIGIGNPDKEHAKTRHNVGWMFLDWLQKKYDANAFKENPKVLAEVAKIDIEGMKGWLVKPLTYVNQSGQSVAKAKQWAKASPKDIVIVQDDLDIPFGKCKLSFDKDAAGHRGIASILSSLRTKKLHRIRIGTAVRALQKARRQNEKSRDAFIRDFVLKTFTPSERTQLVKVFRDCEVRLLQALKS